MMIDINDIKNGMTIILEGQIYQIHENEIKKFKSWYYFRKNS